MDAEEIVMNLIVNGGDAKSKALEAIRAARRGEFEKAEKLMKASSAALNNAHRFQTDLIQAEAAGDKKAEISLLMIHGQDHLMNAMTTRDLAAEIIELCRQLKGKGGIKVV